MPIKNIDRIPEKKLHKAISDLNSLKVVPYINHGGDKSKVCIQFVRAVNSIPDDIFDDLCDRDKMSIDIEHVYGVLVGTISPDELGWQKEIERTNFEKEQIEENKPKKRGRPKGSYKKVGMEKKSSDTQTSVEVGIEKQSSDTQTSVEVVRRKVAIKNKYSVIDAILDAIADGCLTTKEVFDRASKLYEEHNEVKIDVNNYSPSISIMFAMLDRLNILRRIRGRITKGPNFKVLLKGGLS